MANTYQAGAGAQQIILSVDVTTIGLAATRGIVDSSAVAHSSDVTGDIFQSPIGRAADIQNETLIIGTRIDLNIVGDQEAREKEFEKIRASYILNNGSDGQKLFDTFDSIDHNDDFTIAVAKIQIQLT